MRQLDKELDKDVESVDPPEKISFSQTEKNLCSELIRQQEKNKEEISRLKLKLAEAEKREENRVRLWNIFMNSAQLSAGIPENLLSEVNYYVNSDHSGLTRVQKVQPKVHEMK